MQQPVCRQREAGMHYLQCTTCAVHTVTLCNSMRRTGSPKFVIEQPNVPVPSNNLSDDLGASLQCMRSVVLLPHPVLPRWQCYTQAASATVVARAMQVPV